jgi:hypothetical protein
MKFNKNDLKWETHETVSDKIIRQGRWSVQYERVFKHEGKFYLTTYSVGATESQDERPYDYEPDEIECKEVFPVEKTVIVYE